MPKSRKGYLRWWIVGALAGLVALAVHHQILTINLLPLTSSPDAKIHAKKQVLRLVTDISPKDKGPGKVDIQTIKQLSPNLQLWYATLGDEASWVRFAAVDNGRFIALGRLFELHSGAYRPVENPKAEAKAQPEKQKQTIKPDEVDYNASDLMAGQAGQPALVEYASLRCGVCGQLEPAIEAVVARGGVAYYPKILVSAKDKAAMRAFAVLNALARRAPEHYFPVRHLLARELMSGADLAVVNSSLAYLAELADDPVLKEALAAQPTAEVEAQAKRLQEESDRVGIKFTPTYLANGREVEPQAPPKLIEALGQALGQAKEASQ